MKPLSQINQLPKGLREIAQEKKGLYSFILGKFEKHSRNQLHIPLPHYEILRAKSFLDDIMELTDHMIVLSIEDLISLLYDQFLLQVRNAAKISTLRTKILKKKVELAENSVKVISSFEEVNPNHWALVEKQVKTKLKTKVVSIELHRKYIERGEIFLYDLMKVSPNFSMTLEELISLLLIDYVHEIEKGNSKLVMDQIMKAFDEED